MAEALLIWSMMAIFTLAKFLQTLMNALKKLGEVSFAIFIVGELGEGSLGM